MIDESDGPLSAFAADTREPEKTRDAALRLPDLL